MTRENEESGSEKLHLVRFSLNGHKFHLNWLGLLINSLHMSHIKSMFSPAGRKLRKND